MATKKKTAAKKKTTTAKKVDPAKKAVKKTTTAKKAAPKKPAATSKKPVTTVVAQCDVGWGNNLYIRGEGGGLSWEKGILMEASGDNEWKWTSSDAGKGIEFKFLVNDELWSEGENLSILKPGTTSINAPTF